MLKKYTPLLIWSSLCLGVTFFYLFLGFGVIEKLEQKRREGKKQALLAKKAAFHSEQFSLFIQRVMQTPPFTLPSFIPGQGRKEQLEHLSSHPAARSEFLEGVQWEDQTLSFLSTKREKSPSFPLNYEEIELIAPLFLDREELVLLLSSFDTPVSSLLNFSFSREERSFGEVFVMHFLKAAIWRIDE